MSARQAYPYLSSSFWLPFALCAILTCVLAFTLRLLEWPSWQNPEYRLGDQMLMATHDAYHWLAGAVGFGRAVDHPMSVMLREISSVLGFMPANVAFWFPAFLASLVAGMVFVWCAALGNMQTGIAAGLIASISPGFLARTLLGYYDTDLVTLFFPLLISIIPALWCQTFLIFPARIGFSRQSLPFLKKLPFSRKDRENATDVSEKVPDCFSVSRAWIILMALGGLFAWWTQQWHSIFSYIVRYDSILLCLMTLIFAPALSGRALLVFSFSFSLPALAGPYGLILPLLLLLYSFFPRACAKNPPLLTSPRLTICLLLLLFWLILQGDILNTLIAQINAYLKPAADMHPSGTASLAFPSVAQSIIEVQDLSLPALFPYFHPWLEAAIFGFAAFIAIIFLRPVALFLLPLAALGLLSSQLGGRMVMFGAPIVALGLSLPAFWLIRRLLGRWLGIAACGWLSSILLCSLLVAPFADMIPALSQGPIINRRHAAVLSQAATATPEDAILWLWWDWGYAAHYFARRNTIADGAEHGGPSLYLPAAVFATDNARFARQIIRYASDKNNIPGNFFKDMDANEAQQLINSLRSNELPLVRGKGRQFIITSFEMLRLGFWISNYGNWNFIDGQGEGGAISILPQALAYNFNAGEVRLAGRRSIIYPFSITVFEETGLSQKNYVQEWFLSHPRASQAAQKAFLESRRNINFLFNRVTDEKLAMDENIYRSMMVQLLICDPQDPAISPYFRLVYDNVFARIYEILPQAEIKAE